MLQYVNSYACSMNENQKNYVIHFRQNEPIIPEDDDEEITFFPNDIVSIIMDEDCAKSLAESILQLSSSDNS